MPSRRIPHTFKPRNISCPYRGCDALFTTGSGRTRHIDTIHCPLPPVPLPPAPPPAVDEEEYGNTPPPSPNEFLHDDSQESPGLDGWRSHAANTPTESGVAPHPRVVHKHDGSRIEYHGYLDGTPCDSDGYDLPSDTPSHQSTKDSEPQNFFPFNNRVHFELADFFFRKNQISQAGFDELMQLWAATLPPGTPPPFAGHDDYHNTLDAIPFGEVPWQSFSVTYDGPRPVGPAPSWMSAEYDVWFRCPLAIAENHLANPAFADEIDWSPKRVFNEAGKREYCDFMSGNWSWRQADLIAADPTTHGAAFCPLILGSDKTTVSVATGQNEYYPLYLSTGLIHNNVRRAHRNGVSLVGFLAIPKAENDYKNDPAFRKFRRQLFHSSLAHILQSVKPAMKTPRVTRCGDGYFRRVIYGLGPYIADYPEQALLACIVQGWCPKCTALPDDLDESDSVPRSHEHTRMLLDAYTLKELWDEYGVVGDLVPFTVDFPRADIHELLSPDLLHQVIKGTFKDHLVEWTQAYITKKYSKKDAPAVLADIDRRIAAVPGFSGLRRFPQGRGFKQWTGDDSKALMKVYLPAIAGHVEPRVVRALSAFLEFCYLVRRDVITEDTLVDIRRSLDTFHQEREVFRDSGVRTEGFSLPRQHSLKHYPFSVEEFGAPNGLCSSITESAHIKAVKRPYRRSNRNQPLGQMLITNERLDKLAAARVHFASRGMLDGPCIPLANLLSIPSSADAAGDAAVDEESGKDEDGLPTIGDERDSGPVDGYVEAEVVLAKRAVPHLSRRLNVLANELGYPELEELTRRFLYAQLNPNFDSTAVPLAFCPPIASKVFVYPSAVATFHAPSDHSGDGGMRRERIRAVPSWRGVSARRDCVFLDNDPTQPGFRGLLVARVLVFMSFKHNNITYPCALVNWFVPVADAPCSETGLWVVEPELDETTGQRTMEVVHLDCMIRAAHLIGVAGTGFVPRTLRDYHTLDSFRAFYVNKYADHHAHTIAF